MTRNRSILAALVTGFVVLGMSLQAVPGLVETTVEGTVVRAGDTKLTLLPTATGVLERFAVASDATITRNGRNVKLEDIVFGDFALVSVKENPAPSQDQEKDTEVLRVATVIVAVSPFKRHGANR